jgi:hypothetical protein
MRDPFPKRSETYRGGGWGRVWGPGSILLLHHAQTLWVSAPPTLAW